MHRLSFIVFLATFLSAAEPSIEEQQNILARLRAYAVAYGDRLQDFTCIKTVVRSVDTSGTGAHWKPLETQELELNYVTHKETERILKLNGKEPPKKVRLGYTRVGGEFSGLAHVFDPKANVEFTWDHAEGPTCVFRYRVAQESSAAMHWTKGSQKHDVPHHGLIYAECETGRVTRIHLETDEWSKKNDSLQTDVRYSPVTLGGKEYMMPAAADDLSRSGKPLTRARVTFTNYRKYDANSAIHFENDN